MRTAWWLVLIAGCTGPAGGSDAPAPAPDVPADAPPDASLDGGAPIALSCADVHGVEVCSGTADPTGLEPGTEPVATGIVPGEPGRHWSCRPGSGVTWNGRLVLHLVGTYSDPADDHRFPEHACSLGYAAIAPMYENRDMARSTCEEDPDCYEGFHVEVVDGIDRSPVSVDLDDGILHRAVTLLDALAEGDPGFAGWGPLAAQLARASWPDVLVSGHSQGAGHALYVAREHESARLVLLAGPSDQLRDGQPDHAPPPWIFGLPAITATPVDRMHAYMHRDDSIEIVPQVLASWDAIGLGAECPFELDGSYEPSCRRILIPSDRCNGLNAHATVVSRGWGPMCRIGGAGFDNLATWAYLLR